ncbi:mannitol dehydrogenase family protein [Streptomyces sp. NPDC051322]|uniref:mannitol dehydrogenase family protein n=1 Tax=Streptomyces sp. NPDC051322 TaxID=3154645 RepID=UPI00344BE023
MSRLSYAALPGLPPETRPQADPRELRPRIVHLGLGAFHRAHQAVYTEQNTGGGGWGIAGFAQRSHSVVEALRPQDGLYSLTLRHPGAPSTRVVGSLVEVLHATGDAERLTALLTSSDVTVVTSTVTEKGYRRDAVGGGLDLADPLIRADLGADSDHAPATVVGQVANGLRARFRRSGAPLSMVCCDNMAANGPVVARLVREFIQAAPWPERDRLLEWVTEAVAFPATVVDRIVPAATERDRVTAAGVLGVRDEGAVVGEPFTQWVLEDRFAADRPRWETGGARFVADVTPYQLTKLRLLNGAHSLIAQLGLRAGCVTVADALATEWGEEAVRAFCAEVSPTLPSAEGLDIAAYTDALVARFGNPSMHHRLHQIASDSSLKIPERWLAPVRELRAAGRETPQLSRALAAWARGTRDPSAARPADPAAALLHAAWQGRAPADAVRALFTVLGADDLAQDGELVAEVAAEL